MAKTVTSNVRDFLSRYPAAANELVHFSMMFPETMKRFRVPGIPLACLDFLYEVGSGLGLERGTVRTALSRMKKAGYVESVKDGDRARYKVSKLQLEIMGNVLRKSPKTPEGYLLAVYSFEKDQERERALARSLLEYQGFVRFAQNSYISARLDARELRSKLRASGLSGNIFVFEVERIESEDLERMASFWNLPERAAYLKGFLRDAKALIEAENGSDADMFARQSAAWVGYIVNVQATELPLPAELLPEGYCFRDIGEYLKKASARLGRRMIRYYLDGNR